MSNTSPRHHHEVRIARDGRVDDAVVRLRQRGEQARRPGVRKRAQAPEGRAQVQVGGVDECHVFRHRCSVARMGAVPRIARRRLRKNLRRNPRRNAHGPPRDAGAVRRAGGGGGGGSQRPGAPSPPSASAGRGRSGRARDRARAASARGQGSGSQQGQNRRAVAPGGAAAAGWAPAPRPTARPQGPRPESAGRPAPRGRAGAPARSVPVERLTAPRRHCRRPRWQRPKPPAGRPPPSRAAPSAPDTATTAGSEASSTWNMPRSSRPHGRHLGPLAATPRSCRSDRPEPRARPAPVRSRASTRRSAGPCPDRPSSRRGRTRAPSRLRTGPPPGERLARTNVTCAPSVTLAAVAAWPPTVTPARSSAVMGTPPNLSGDVRQIEQQLFERFPPPRQQPARLPEVWKSWAKMFASVPGSEPPPGGHVHPRRAGRRPSRRQCRRPRRTHLPEPPRRGPCDPSPPRRCPDRPRSNPGAPRPTWPRRISSSSVSAPASRSSALTRVVVGVDRVNGAVGPGGLAGIVEHRQGHPRQRRCRRRPWRRRTSPRSWADPSSRQTESSTTAHAPSCFT